MRNRRRKRGMKGIEKERRGVIERNRGSKRGRREIIKE